MTLLFALLLAAAQTAAPPAQPAPPPANVSEAPARADGMVLAGIVNPEGPMIDMLVRNFESVLRSGVKENEDYQALELEHPGLSEALVQAMTKAMKADAIADFPRQRQRYARFFASQFTPDEVSQLIHFYSSAAGQRLVMAKYAKLDAAPFASNPEVPVSADQIRAANRNAANSISTDMSEADRAALIAFAKTPVFAKLTKARMAMEQLEAEIANEPDPELDAALEAATNEVLAKFTGESPQGE